MRRFMDFEVVVIVALVFASSGCGAKSEDAPAPPAMADKKPPPQGFARKLRRPQAQNELRQIALLYVAYLDTNRAPKNVQAFTDSIKLEARQEVQALDDGWYVMNLKARKGSSEIVVYEAEADESGNVYAARLDGTVHTMTMDQVKAELPK